MNKSQQAILGGGLLVLSLVLHLALCKWDTWPDSTDVKVFDWLYVRNGISMLTGVLLGVVAPLVSAIVGFILLAANEK